MLFILLLCFIHKNSVSQCNCNFSNTQAQSVPDTTKGKRGFVPIEVKGNSVTLPFTYRGNFALVIGISDYNNGWDSLPGVRNDIQRVEEALAKHHFEVIVCRNPTRRQLEDTITYFISHYGQEVDNRLIVYFAGHGYSKSLAYGDYEGYIVPVDAPDPRIDSTNFMMKAKMIRDFTNYSTQIQAKHALFMFDACFSGALFSGTIIQPLPVTIYTGQQVRQFITSGSANQTVPDKSIFCDLFVQALSSYNADMIRDSFLTASELGAFLQMEFIKRNLSLQQTPQYGKSRDERLSKGDFVFSLRENLNNVPPVYTQGSSNFVDPVKFTNPTFIDQTSGIKFIRIKCGTFKMGSPSGEWIDNENKHERPSHSVNIDCFYISETEVTQQQWTRVMGNNPSNFRGNTLPVETVSWNDCQIFIEKLRAKTNKMFRLPTEAEWEYACRAGTTTPYNTGGCLSTSQANYDGTNRTYQNCGQGENRKTTLPVKSFSPNAWGLYDMHGNVWEWCNDGYGTYENTRQTNPKGAVNDSFKVLRGGSFRMYGPFCRSASRLELAPDKKGAGTGFRLVYIP